MKKKIVASLIALFLIISPMMGQMIYTDEDAGINPRAEVQNGEYVMVPMQGLYVDQFVYTPVGEGLLVLAALGGGYLALKRRKKQ